MRLLCITTVKDEGPYLLEWIAHYKAAGVTDFLIFSNDCSDGTEAMLQILQQAGVVRHIDHKLTTGRSIQWQALKAAWAHPLVTKADWILVSDIDEFVNIKAGKRRFEDLIGAISPETDGIMMQWRLFGHNGVIDLIDAPVTTQFTKAIAANATYPIAASLCKTLFKPSTPFRMLGVHRPKQKPLEKSRRPIFVDGSGSFIDQDFALNEKRISFFGETPGRALVEMNHYAIKSVAGFLIKRARGLPNRKKAIDLAYWVERNFNNVTDTSISKMAPNTQVALEELLFLPGMRKLHDAAITWHQRQFAQLSKDPQTHALLTKLVLADSSQVPPKDVQRRLVSLYHDAQTAAAAKRSRQNDQPE